MTLKTNREWAEHAVRVGWTQYDPNISYEAELSATDRYSRIPAIEQMLAERDAAIAQKAAQDATMGTVRCGRFVQVGSLGLTSAGYCDLPAGHEHHRIGKGGDATEPALHESGRPITTAQADSSPAQSQGIGEGRLPVDVTSPLAGRSFAGADLRHAPLIDAVSVPPSQGTSHAGQGGSVCGERFFARIGDYARIGRAPEMMCTSPRGHLDDHRGYPRCSPGCDRPQGHGGTHGITLMPRPAESLLLPTIDPRIAIDDQIEQLHASIACNGTQLEEHARRLDRIERAVRTLAFGQHEVKYEVDCILNNDTDETP